MITIKNIQTGETKKVFNTEFVNGYVRNNEGKVFGKRFANSWAGILTETKDEDGQQVFTLSADWEVVTGKGERKPRQPKAKKAEPQQKDEPTKDEQPAAVEVVTEDDATNEQALIAALKNLRGGAVDIAKVREIVREEVAKQEPTKVVHTIKIADAPETTLPSQPHPLLQKVLSLVVSDRVIGRFPWLFGPAGSGKSTIAKQVAEALNLPFYSVSSLQQKYELEGYTDATGKLVETTFYKAAKEGGIFLFDEASTTSAEVQVAFNNMLANLVYNFPKEGMITAHKDFHIIAADNTTGRGGNKTYSARYSMDASTLDRYIPIEVDYTMEQDMMMAANDSELVTFLRDLRKVISEANLTYTASPRAAKAIKAMQQMDCFTELEAFNLGLCSGWKKQDIRTLNARLDGTTKYHKLFNKIANS